MRLKKVKQFTPMFLCNNWQGQEANPGWLISTANVVYTPEISLQLLSLCMKLTVGCMATNRSTVCKKGSKNRQ